LTLIICEEKCKICGKPLVKNPLCSGDWHPTFRSHDELLRYCNNPICPGHGHMYPYISIPWGYISNKKKMDIAKMCAGLSGRGYIEMKQIARNIKQSELCFFLEHFIDQSHINPVIVNMACQRLRL